MKKYRLFILSSSFVNKPYQVLVDQTGSIIFENIIQIGRGWSVSVEPTATLSKAFQEHTPPNKEYNTIEEFIADNFEDIL